MLSGFLGTELNQQGVASAIPTTIQRHLDIAPLTAAIRDSKKVVKASRSDPNFRADIKTQTQFWERVGKAMRRGDEDINGNPYVSDFSKRLRSEVVEPLKDRAIANGLLPEDVSVDTAISYFTRRWDKNKIVAKDTEFRDLIKPHIQTAVSHAEDAAGLSAKELDQYADDVVDEVVERLKGISDTRSFSNITIKARGPLAERTFNIPDEVVEDFLVSDAREVLGTYVRTMSIDTSLKERFGDVDLKEKIRAINDDYTSMIKAVEKEKIAPEAKEKKRLALEKRRKADISDIETMRDMLRGTWAGRDPGSIGSNLSQILLSWNFARLLGSVSLASIPDVARSAMLHGTARYLKDGIAPLLKKITPLMDGAKLEGALRESKLAGLDEVTNLSRIESLTELTNPYRTEWAFTRMSKNIATRFSYVTGLPYWNQIQKALNVATTEGRIFDAVLGGKLTTKERAWLAENFIGEDEIAIIKQQFSKHGDAKNKTANTDKWDNTPAVNSARTKYRAALNRQANTAIVTPDVGERPFFTETNLGKIFFQFRSFAFSSHQRVLLQGLQQRDAAVVGGIVQMIALGMFTYAVREGIIKGKELSDDPRQWIFEGIDRSGLLAVMMDVNNIAGKVNLGAERMMGLKPASRFASRNVIGSIFGPTVGTINDVAKVVGDLGAGEFDKADVDAIARLIPAQNLFYIRPFLEAGKGKIKEALDDGA